MSLEFAARFNAVAKEPSARPLAQELHGGGLYNGAF
jgi:hypothetical protein